MGIERTASSRQIDLGMQNQWVLSILQHKMQKNKLPYFSLYFWADSFENLKCPATAHFLTENSEIFSGSLFLITTGLVNSPWWNSTKLQILDTLLVIQNCSFWPQLTKLSKTKYKLGLSCAKLSTCFAKCYLR